MRTHRTLVAAAALAGLAAAAAAGPADDKKAICEQAEARYVEIFGKPTSAAAPAVVVTMFNHTFCPQRLGVKQGTVLRFVNVDKRTSHSFWFRDAGRPESERFFQGEGADMAVDLPPGEHVFLCGPHWEHEKMTGVLTVTP